MGHTEKGCKAKRNALRLTHAAVFNTEQIGGNKINLAAAMITGDDHHNMSLDCDTIDDEGDSEHSVGEAGEVDSIVLQRLER